MQHKIELRSITRINRCVTPGQGLYRIIIWQNMPRRNRNHKQVSESQTLSYRCVKCKTSWGKTQSQVQTVESQFSTIVTRLTFLETPLEGP